MPFKFRISTLEAGKNDYPRGRHYGNWAGLSDVERKLISDNIKWGVNVFGIVGTMTRWVADWTKAQSIPLPTLARSIVEDHSGGSNINPLTLSPPEPTLVAVSENSMVVLHDCETDWTEYVEAHVVESLDGTDKQVGSNSISLDVGADTPVGRLATTSIALSDLRDYRYIRMWIKSSVDISSGQLSLLIDDTPACVSPLKDLDIGALTAGTWTQVSLPLGDASSLSSVVSIGIDMDTDKGAFTLKLDQIRATKGA